MRHLSSFALALVLALPAVAQGDNKADAKAHLDKAMAAHKEGRFDEAKTALEAAYALDPQPPVLYALGQVHVKLGKCTEAIGFYEQFLATKPAKGASDAATQAIVTCRVALAQAEQAKPKEEPPPPPEERSDVQLPPIGEDVERPTTTTTGEGPSGPTPWYKDKILLGLGGLSVVSGAVGVVLYLNARSTLDEADGKMTYGEAQAVVDDAKSSRLMSVVFGGVGVALAAGTAVYFLKRDAGEANRVSVTPTTSGGLVSVSGRF